VRKRVSRILKKAVPLTTSIITEVKDFSVAFGKYLLKLYKIFFARFGLLKGKSVAMLYKQRGKHTRRFVHSGMAGLAAVGIVVAPVIANEFPGTSIDPWEIRSPSQVLSASTEGGTATVISDKLRSEIIEYEVQQGETVGTIADKFGISQDTIRWRNDLGSKDTIKAGQTLEILPVTGVAYKVGKGETVYSIAKKLDSSAQAIVDYPFNTFTNDETFGLAVGQTVIVPDGVKPQAKVTSPRRWRVTPDAGAVVASGNFVWPASGQISQNFHWYHKGIDISNRGAPNILAADSGSVVLSTCLGWGYGCHIIVDHGNGYRTLYAHLSSLYVSVGQSVARGNAIGRMGSTGRSTGTHLHFEVIKNGTYLHPLNVLQ
jgi:murein DD-endopeptidase MepM/ murein hydrolase activator NlpD